MWVPALVGVFLAVAKACIFCRLPAHALPSRLARLSSQMEKQWKEWASPDFSAFALDEVTMNKITEKTHRVLRVMEIKRSISSLPSYWQWLQKTKIPQYTREGTATCKRKTREDAHSFPTPALRNLCPQFLHPLGWEQATF
nr:sperm-egg fusion protein TMEM95 isoform X6 [Peromyscus maniculatus bairdii]